jgi:hypothetical protein
VGSHRRASKTVRLGDLTDPEAQMGPAGTRFPLEKI